MDIDSKARRLYTDLNIDNTIVIHYFTTDKEDKIDGIIIETYNKTTEENLGISIKIPKNNLYKEKDIEVKIMPVDNNKRLIISVITDINNRYNSEEIKKIYIIRDMKIDKISKISFCSFLSINEFETI